MTAETLQFQAETDQLLSLMIHSVYSEKDVFLRELISNASDACDKLRFEALDNDKLYGGDSDLGIWIETDRKARTISVRDNGIGMSRDDVVDLIGTLEDVLVHYVGANDSDRLMNIMPLHSEERLHLDVSSSVPLEVLG